MGHSSQPWGQLPGLRDGKVVRRWWKPTENTGTAWETWWRSLSHPLLHWENQFAPWKKSYDQHRQHIKKQRHYFSDKGPSSQSYGFSSSHVWMWELDYKQSWAPKNWCFWTVVLEKTLESLLDCKEIKPVNPKGNQSWIFTGRTDAETETPILWPPNVKNWLIWKDPDTGKNWRQEKKGMTEDEMVGWNHWLDGQESEQAPGVGEGQGSLVCCSPWGCKQSDTTEPLNWTEPARTLPESSQQCVRASQTWELQSRASGYGTGSEPVQKGTSHLHSSATTTPSTFSENETSLPFTMSLLSYNS